MKKIVISLFEFVARVDLGAIYPVAVPSFITLLYAVIFVIGIFCYRVRKTDKTVLLAVTLSVYTLSAIKAICDLTLEPTKDNLVLSCACGLFMSALSFAFYGLLCLQYNCRFKLNGKEKRLIARLSALNADNSGDVSDTPEPPEIIKAAFANSPFKRIEYLPAESGNTFGREQTDNLNYGEILCYAEKLERHDLTSEESAEIRELKTRIESYSRKTISCDERKDLSLKLMRFLKLISKYKVS